MPNRLVPTLIHILDRIPLGIVLLDRDLTIHLWNGFMEMHSGRKAEDLIGENLFRCFPDLPQHWFQKKIQSVFLFENCAFSSWKNRPYLFPFHHHRPVTGNIDFMRQDCIFFPIRNLENQVEFVCLAISDATDNFLYETQLQQAMSALEKNSRLDGLTGIFNRAYFETRLIEEFRRNKRYNEEFGLILLDLDYFKKVNDTYGHLAGDEVLRSVAQTINRVIRSIDLFGRYGGEEFAVFLPHTSLEGTRNVAERIRHAIENQRISFEDHLITITTSLGITLFHPDLQDHEQLIHEADQALYHAKMSGRNRVSCYRDLGDS